jgi:hypothetical protein
MARDCPSCGHPLQGFRPAVAKQPRSTAKRLQLVGGLLALFGGPFLAIDPMLALLVATPGLAVFVAGRIME